MKKLVAPRGTQDVLPDQWRIRRFVLDVAAGAFERAGYGRISTPTFEDTALFARGVGASTDIVAKEMYTFSDRSDRSLTLRPEGTAPVVRSYIAEGMHRRPQPVKLWYFAPMFRYEKPQEGRYREHYQIGAEVFGADSPAVDAELIALLGGIYDELAIPDVALRLNSIGDSECRPAYRTLLVAFLRERQADLCEDCVARIDTNPLRCFDCKVESCQSVMDSAPVGVDHLCGACSDHFARVRELLDAADIAYRLDPTLVRGLDYYNRTTFEFSCSRLGAQDGIGGGGRYDTLVSTLGGPDIPGVGFGSGIERIVLAMQSVGTAVAEPKVDVYVCPVDEATRPKLFAAEQRLRWAGFIVESDVMGRSLNGQLKTASRRGATIALVGDVDGFRAHVMHGRTEHPIATDSLVEDVQALLDRMATPTGAAAEETRS